MCLLKQVYNRFRHLIKLSSHSSLCVFFPPKNSLDNIFFLIKLGISILIRQVQVNRKDPRLSLGGSHLTQEGDSYQTYITYAKVVITSLTTPFSTPRDKAEHSRGFHYRLKQFTCWLENIKQQLNRNSVQLSILDSVQTTPLLMFPFLNFLTSILLCLMKPFTT